MVRADRIPCMYSVFEDATYTYAYCNECGGTNYKDVIANRQTIVQNAIDTLEAGNGGVVWLKEVQLPVGCTYENDILIVEDYQGKRRYYSNTYYMNIDAGSATITAQTTTKVVNHTLGTSAIVVTLTPTTDFNKAFYKVTTKTSTQFTIEIDSDDPFDDITFDWIAVAKNASP